MLNCEICMHGSVCKHTAGASETEEKVKEIKIDGMPDIWIIVFDLKCKHYLPKHKATVMNKVKKKAVPEKVVNYVNAMGAENFDRTMAHDYFVSIGLTDKSAWTYADIGSRYVRDLIEEKEQGKLDADMKKIKKEDLALKRSK